tara:strand:- start:1035 stop:1793 length:759 start_codon:yes stop_codon:yes gene_type:complete
MKKKTVFITGSSNGLGFYLAKHFLDNDYKVIIHSRSKIKATKASKKLNDCPFVIGDCSSEKDVNRISKELQKKSKKLDILICNAGNSSINKNFKESHKDWITSFNDNFFSAVNIVTKLSKIFIKQKKGKIICISSICGVDLIKNSPITYSLAKNTLINFVKFYSKYISKYNVNINCISPGNLMFPGSVWETKKKGDLKKINNFIRKEVALRKFGKPREIFQMINYLSSNESDFVSGSNFVIDGGQVNDFKTF